MATSLAAADGPLRKISGLTLENGAEINAFDVASQRLFVVSGETELQGVDLSNPDTPIALEPIDLSPFGGGANSVAIHESLIAVAIAADPPTNAGHVVFLNAEGDILANVRVGSLPDQLTFTPDGMKVLVANEGEPEDGINPAGSISIIDLAGGIETLAPDNVTTVGFEAFNGREAELRAKGVRIFPDQRVAQDVEPKYISVSPDGTTAFVTLQENNAVAVVDLASETVQDILPLGVKDFSQGPAELTQLNVERPLLGVTAAGDQIQLGGLSGLWFGGTDADSGNLIFYTIPDRGPNPDTLNVDADGINERPFALPDYQARIVKLEVTPDRSQVAITKDIFLRQGDGITPITGRSNLDNEDIDEQPVDLSGNPLPLDPFGGDFEGILTDADGNFWMVDEYRPAIYQFSPTGVLLNRYVPEGTAAQVDQAEGTFGKETLPHDYINRRRNRGFEAVALDAEAGILYAFIQTPLANPDRDTSDNSDVIRILGIDTTTGQPVSEYVYLLEDPAVRDGGRVDKIGDAVYAGDGKFFVIERDSAVGDTAKKFVFEINLQGATNVLGLDVFGDQTLEQQTADDLAAFGIQTVHKRKVTNLPSLGYLAGDKPEGLALLPDGSLAVLNDNDFGLTEGDIPLDGSALLNPDPTPTTLGFIDFGEGNRLDPSDEDGGINLQNHPVFGLYQPDAIASYEVNGQTYYITANEGDARDEDARISELALDPDAFPDAETLQQDENLGRLQVSTIDGDLDGDGDYDQLFSYGGRSFSIWDAVGNQVFDSGDQIARITAAQTPELFNADDGDPEAFDSRSDNKGAEPEAVTVGVVGSRTYAFIGLERAGGGVLVYDVSTPTQPEFLQYIRSDEDIAPEGLTFISAEDSPNGRNLLVVTNEESSTVGVFEFTPPLKIYDIQGEGHLSPFTGQMVSTTGIVTAIAFNGFYLQDSEGDGNDNTSDGIFVFTGEAPEFGIGDELALTGEVSEFIPGGADTGNLSVTQLSNISDTTVLSSGNALPEAVVIGEAGRLPSNTTVISEDELPVNLQEQPGEFDPENDAIDFYESLEGQRVTIEDAVAVSPTRVFSTNSAEAFTLPNQGATSDDPLNARGGINLDSGLENTGDQNPEIVQIQFDPTLSGQDIPPALNVGDQLGDVTGVVGYSFGNFEVNVTDPITVAPGGLEQEATELIGTDSQLTVASYNVLNLDPSDGDATPGNNDQFDRLAQQIVNHLQAPDIIALQEIQDNSGSIDDGTLDADQTLQTVVDVIAAAGGPTYEFRTVNTHVDGAFGGQPGGNIRNAFLFNPDRVSIDDTTLTLLSPDVLAEAGVSNPDAFDGSRSPLLANFEFNGQTVAVVNNHFSSRFGSTPVFGGPQPFVQAGEDARAAQALAINEFVDSQLADNPDANIIVAGDLNTFQFTDEIAEILPGTGDEQVLTNLVPQAEAEGDAYTFIFNGNSQVLDHLFVTDSLLEGAEFDIVHVNTDFTRDDSAVEFDNTVVASDHEPIVGRFNIAGEGTDSPFTLEILHTADQEAGIPALDDIPNFSAVLNALKAQDLGDDGEPDNTVVLSSGDAIIPGLFFSASEDVLGGAGRADILIQNELGFQAIGLGNHEFDLGTELLADLIGGAEDDPTTPDVDESFAGTAFPYLSANLDFSTDANLAGLVVEDAQAPQANSLAASTVIEVNGEQIGVVGATTPTLTSISSPGDVTVLPGDFEGDPTPEQLDALAAEIQADVDALLAANPEIDKVVLLSHMQQISIEQALATRLQNVDIVMAGGSNTRLIDENDRLRDGDTAQGEYPLFTTDANGHPVAIINTDGNYKYVGRLVIEFDEQGHVIPASYDPEVSGAYATDDQGVADLNAEGLVDPEIQGIVDQLREVIVAKESNVFGLSEVYLDGRRERVRTEETNLGNLTADANLALAKSFDSSVVISLKNGGGIRDDIGQVIVPPGGTGDPEELPTEAVFDADGNLVKPAGGISETDIANTLSFNNSLTLLTLTPAELLAVIEHSVAATGPGETPGQFPQVSGIQFSFAPNAPAGDRIQSLAITDEEGNDVDVVVQAGELVGDASRTFRIVTLNFLAEGGDEYPFPTGPDANRVDLPDVLSEEGEATFADPGTEQDALAEYLAINFPADTDAATPTFSTVETAPVEDTRIQNLTVRDDTVIDDQPPVLEEILGTNGRDSLLGTENDDQIRGLKGPDIIWGKGGNDLIAGNQGPDQLFGGAGNDTINGGKGNDDVFGGTGNDFIAGNRGSDQLFGGAGNDTIKGGRGRDDLFGGAGNDLLSGRLGRDQLFGGAGDDTLDGGDGRDILIGGRGADCFIVGLDQGPDTVLDFNVDADTLGLSAGLTLGQLRATTENGDTRLSLTGSEQTLMILQGVMADLTDLNIQADFSV
ncbi:choice-of-anchor I family protein [Acaryochloris sp. IP29b_bin.148]|uniref:choice-of-anchor I family protein n=1 Tax=Acaryochloris sp. IP29b_bin.148 TaxID=2969218 RepID=UPI0026261762|nr:choice-of-anchor I family protein [Acaryochloris sp. IP29b_bin.148]